MKFDRFHPLSLLAGFGFAAIGLFAMGHAPAPSTAKLEYKVVDDVDEGEVEKLASEGWEYAGYLGQGVKGNSNDQTLWKRTK